MLQTGEDGRAAGAASPGLRAPELVQLPSVLAVAADLLYKTNTFL